MQIGSRLVDLAVVRDVDRLAVQGDLAERLVTGGDDVLEIFLEQRRRDVTAAEIPFERRVQTDRGGRLQRRIASCEPDPGERNVLRTTIHTEQRIILIRDCG